MTLEKILKSRKILVCCGSGGVGKTTLAAALALKGAESGRKTLVLTIDPARRLAAALGLDHLSDRPQTVPLGGATPSTLDAMMLDTKRTFDRLIERHAPSREACQRIFRNRLYQHLSDMIAGSQEYMAMEQLYEIYQKNDYDLIVLDTPPTRHALDFLEAPGKMIRLTGASALKWFLKPGMFATRLGLGALQRAGKKIVSVFDRLAGISFLQEVAEMVSLLTDLLGGFHERATRVYELLRNDFVGFFLVATPHAVSIQDSLYFHEKIEEGRLPFAGFIVNRVILESPKPPPHRLSALPTPLREKVDQAIDQQNQLARRDRAALELLKKMGRKSSLLATIPLLSEDVHDLDGLRRVNEHLFR